jgi:chemotaxis protein MotB
MRTQNLQSSRHNESQHRDRWLLSYADLVTLLLALFIVMYAASDHERAKEIARSFSSQQELGGDGILPEHSALVGPEDRFEEKLQSNPVLSGKTKMRQTERGFVVSISEAGLFAPGEATVNDQAGEILRSIAESVTDSRTPIRVEGHSDSKPISNSKYPSNWELSAARASSVLITLTEAGIVPERLSAAGYGGFQPVADNATVEGRAQNRRVDVVILNR